LSRSAWRAFAIDAPVASSVVLSFVLGLGASTSRMMRWI